MRLEILSTDFRNILKKYSNISVMKVRPVGAELFHVDRQTDVTKLIVAFRNFANVPKKQLEIAFKEGVVH
jgi:hypothetical protein